MMQFIIGVILGIMIATIGVTGVAKMADSGVDKIKTIIKEGDK
jgi:hypothetical protein